MKINITPHTGLVEALRNSSHTPYTAVADIIDNSIEADAENIQIIVDTFPENKEKLKMVIVDDGNGMDMKTLSNAFQYGNHTSTDSTLGRFGMGMKTSATTLGKSFYVLTKRVNGKLIKGTFEPDIILSTKKWEAEVGETVDENDIKGFNSYVSSNSGTVLVILDLSANFKASFLHQFKTILIKHLGRTFRYFLTPIKQLGLKTTSDVTTKDEKSTASENLKPVSIGKMRIFVNNTEVFGASPLERHLDSTEIVFDDKIETPMGIVWATMTKLDWEFEPKSNFVFRPDHVHQGIYVVRENRAIMDHDVIVFEDVYGARHSSANHIRTEIRYSKDMDKAFLVNHDKCGLKSVDQGVMDKIKSVLSPIISQLKRERSNKTAKVASTNEELIKIHDGICKDLAAKKNLLDLPTEKKIARKKGINVGPVRPQNTGIKRSGKEKTSTKVGNFAIGCGDYGPAGAVFEFEFKGKNGSISWNVSHPFVQKFLTLNEEGHTADQIRSLNIIAFAIASYFEQICGEQDEIGWEARDRFVASFAQNLRQLAI